MPAYCSFCGAELSAHDTTSDSCQACHQAFHNDVAAKKIPAGLPAEGYNFSLWKHIRQLERDVLAGRRTEADAKEEVTRLVEGAKKDYEKRRLIQDLEKQALVGREREFSGPTGFLI